MATNLVLITQYPTMFTKKIKKKFINTCKKVEKQSLDSKIMLIQLGNLWLDHGDERDIIFTIMFPTMEHIHGYAKTFDEMCRTIRSDKRVKRGDIIYVILSRWKKKTVCHRQ